MNVLFCGSRDIGAIECLKLARKSIAAELDLLDFVKDTVVHGGATGIDSLVNILAKERGYYIRVFNPDYRMHGNQAPLVRDKQMVNVSEKVIAIWNGFSRGTRYTVNYAVEQKLPTKVYVLESCFHIRVLENKLI